MPRGEASQVLIYAITAVIGAMVLIFGYRVITSLTSSSDKMLRMDFQTELTKDIDLASAYGAVQTRTYHLPAGVREVCFINTNADADFSGTRYPTITDSWQSGAKSNVFLLPGDEQFRVDALQFADCDGTGGEDHHLCVTTKGAITIQLFGEGNATRVEWDGCQP